MNNVVTLPSLEVPVTAEVDVVVVGGGPAGVAAAIAAGRNGASVILIEQRGYLGGMATVSQVPAFCPYTDQEKLVIRGIGLEILNDMKARMEEAFQAEWEGLYDWVPIDREVLKVILDKKIQEAGVEVLFHSFVSNVLYENRMIQGVIVHNKTGTSVVKGRLYIDASSDADLVYRAGGQLVSGGDEGELQPGTMCFELGNLDRQEFLKHKDEVGLNLKWAIRKAKQQNKLNVTREWAGIAWLNNEIAGFNFGHVFGIDGSKSEDLTRGAMEGRALVQHITDWLRNNVPGFERAVLLSTGEQVGIRETRRIVGDYVITADDFIACRSFEDNIARNSYFIDIHMTNSSSKMHMVHLPPGESHGIPYRALLPVGMENILVAGRSISTDRETQGSTRVMPNCFAMGEAAGTAAALLTKQGMNRTRQVNMKELQEQLVQQGAWI